MKSKIKYISFIVYILVLAFAFTNCSNQEKEHNNGDNKASVLGDSFDKSDVSSSNLVEMNEYGIKYDHTKMALNCKDCHSCEYPTRQSPCLKDCPRNELVTVYHSPEEGPVLVEMDQIKGDYKPFMFTHKIHAQMATMSGGCQTCHHYNTSGPIQKCSNCHVSDRAKAKNIHIPDLESAYHRLCLTCHREWSHSTDCQQCHLRKDENPEEHKKSKIAKYQHKDHPPLVEPGKIVYQTKYNLGKFVTFHHDDHAKKFGLECKSCHSDDNCLSCHDYWNKQSDDDCVKMKKTHKTFQQHHAPCSKCHTIENNCSFCHKDKETDKFDHSSTGFTLGANHSHLQCNACHKKPGVFKGLNKNCTSCHTDFVMGKFDHKKTGLQLNEMHADFDCSSCHTNNNFTVPPVCDDCHDGYKYPAKKPGKLIKKK